jgi:pyruvate kinase
MPIHELPVYQKKILDMCFVYGKPVIIATELMKSMVSNPFPTRAEVSDVYNSVIMRADAVMLSDETAVGKYPVKAVQYMEKTVVEAEKTTCNKHKDFDLQSEEESEVLKKALARYALMLADDIHAKVVVAFSYSGNLARYLSAFKPNQPVISFTTEEVLDYSFGINY